MIEAIFVASLGQALMLSLAVVVLWLVRPCLLRFGAGLTYAAWWLVPAFLLTPVLPRPSVEPVRLALAGWSGWRSGSPVRWWCLSGRAGANGGWLGWGSICPPAAARHWWA